jgi:hypothetical protein
MTAEEEEGYIRKAVEAYKKTSPSGKVPVGVSALFTVTTSGNELNAV